MKTSIADIASILELEDFNTPNPLLTIEYLLTDSRSLINPHSSLFFAIRTSGNDGHKYILSLYQKGVRSFVVEYIPEVMKTLNDINWIIVDNTINALQRIAARKVNTDTFVVAITGSRGKTTLKEWIYQLLEPLCNISRSPIRLFWLSWAFCFSI